MMTRENLLQAIYDNTNNWSCQSDCPHTMEEENPQEVCMECANNLLAEYEKQIRADAIDEFVAFANTMPTVDNDGEIRPMWLEGMAEQLKEQKNE